MALATGRPLAVLCLDLDRFKEVNDLFGHAAGDTLLQTVANCVSGLLDDNQMMARLGGDEFAIIAPALSDPAVCRQMSGMPWPASSKYSRCGLPSISIAA